MSEHLMQSYHRLDVAFVRGEGPWLFDEQGNRYLDALSGIAVCGLGHAHPAVASALCKQAAELVHTSNLYRVPLQEQLADRLCALGGMDKAFFCNSGAEANEAAIKLARLYGHQRGIKNPAVVVMEGSFHGRTLATLSATGSRKVQAGFEPLVQGFVRVPYNDIGALAAVAEHSHDAIAVLVEPVQGEGGVVVPDRGYLAAIRKLCDERNWLLMLDEVQTGMCRTGAWFAYQHEDLLPDVVTLAKALGNGFPIGACLARAEAAQLFKPGNHASTFGGNPLACAAALAVIKTLEDGALARRAAQSGQHLLDKLRDALAGVDGVTDVRGMGLMLGIELDRPCGELVQAALSRGLLINVTSARVVRLLPPLIIDDEQVDHIADAVGGLVREFLTAA